MEFAFLSSCLALKGGTAINLTIFNLPRLSVDIDLDFSENINRDEMLEKRPIITERSSITRKLKAYRKQQQEQTYPKPRHKELNNEMEL